MELSLFFAKLLGLYKLIVSVVWIFRKKDTQGGFKEVVASKGLLAVSASMCLIFGIVIAITHSIWEWNFMGLITLLGYIMILKGIMRLGFPAHVKKFYMNLSDRGLWCMIIVMLIIGIYLTYMGFHTMSMMMMGQ